MVSFWIDLADDVSISYRQLIDDINRTTEIPRYVESDNSYDIYKNVLLGMATGQSITILDSDVVIEADSPGNLSDSKLSDSGSANGYFDDHQDLLQSIRQSADEAEVGIFTSGTTGEPEKIVHTGRTLFRTIKTGSEFSKNTWGFTYNPTHFAGFQVLFQAFFNKNPLVNLYDMNPSAIEDALSAYDVTHISATPTFYRLYLTNFERTHESVRQLTSGGEALPDGLVETLKEQYPNAEITNVYATTETGALLETGGSVFTVPDHLESKIKFEDGELLVHRSLLAKSKQNDLADEWFRTGDLVEFVGDNQFQFTGRRSQQINVAGYTVHPQRVEKTIESHPEVTAALVKARENSVTGRLIEAEIKPKKDIETSSSDLKEDLT